MSGPSDVPAVVVERAPDGWTHIGGPGMHLLIGLDEEDDRTLAASDAADGGDLDDVLEVLTAGGMRKAHHFVGVHWQPRSRIVAFGPVSAQVTLSDGSEHDVRATSARVWTDLELPEHPERVVLRVLEESERSQPQPPQTLGSPPVAGPPVGAAAEVADGPDEEPDPEPAPESAPDSMAAPDAPPRSEPAPATGATEAATPETPAVTSAGPDAPVAPQPPSSSRWDRSWAVPAAASVASVAPVEPTRAPDAKPAAAPDREPLAQAAPEPVPPSAPPQEPERAAQQKGAPGRESAPELRPWSSVRPPVAPPSVSPASTPATAAAPSAAVPASVTQPPGPPSTAPAAPEVPAAEVPAADDLPPAAPRDVDSTWAARPVLEPETVPTSAPAPVAAAPDDAQADAAQPAVPSYDYLFGHTTAADEHRRVLAQLSRSEEDEEPADDDVPSAPPVPAVADTSEAPVTNLPPAPEVPAAPVPVAHDVPAEPEGGLISSVPWASPASTPEVPKPEPEVPHFSGRHTPPPPPSLLPPLNTPPPGARAPEATPLISTLPVDSPPAAPANTPLLPSNVDTVPTPAPTVPSAPEVGTAYPAVSRPGAEPTFEVPIAPRPPVAAPATTPPIALAPIASAPIASAPTASAPIATPPEDDDDAELTVDRSALLEARHAAQNQTVSGPSVLAVLCSAGHPTPPHSDRCRVCGAGIPPQGPFTMPRPPLGVLRLSTGDVVTLDRSVLLGRAPKLGDGLAVHDRPHVVKVPSPERDISRNHVEVILEGWHVLIRDLGTTNGTTVTLPGESPVRLRANDQQVLEPGSLVSMADEVSFTFETAI
ncbi:FHA domain-containing protein [Terrabacter sp. NPDC080008]|uniref:FHA domain-containing protein n=1 Tax=Terrabacter sp. NPDC080008 TaxID=3155176 RepID=UPI00344E7338